MTVIQPKTPASVWDMYFDPKVFDMPTEYRTGTFKHGNPIPDETPSILTKARDTIDLCASGIDETLDLNDASSDILKGIIVGVTVGLIVLKVIK